MKVMVLSDDRNFKDKKHIKQAIETFEYEIEEVVFMCSGKGDGGNDEIQTTAKEWAVENGKVATPFKIDWNNTKVPGAVIKKNKFGEYNQKAAVHCKEQMMDYCDGIIFINDCYDVKKAEKEDRYVHVYDLDANKSESEYEHDFWG